MQNKYIKDVAVPEFDARVSKVMKAAEFDGGGHDMVVAVENEQGQVYRLFTTTGLSEYMGAVDKLLGLGMKDRLADKPTSREGYDSRFHF